VIIAKTSRFAGLVLFIVYVKNSPIFLYVLSSQSR
jgi:hypothetical protein